ncbi:MAG TPA: acyltransferase [Solirubrobacteraceae bacterium]|jgi:peptidoglycan/LPS O-acetylase OafA/YrhL|nr:acyltransferase [Solirubrobacteraceae bacterium]
MGSGEQVAAGSRAGQRVRSVHSRAGQQIGGVQSLEGQRVGRVHALDGLRGLAAVVVVLHHALLASAPSLASVYGAAPPSSLRTVEWLLAYTPLHIVWAGQEFVVVFFVLSGFVLSLPAVHGKRQPVASYYPSRLLRLYVPVWGALGFAAIVHVAVRHRMLDGASFWLNNHSQALTLAGLTREATLLTGAGDWAFTTVLWSLRWEVVFSLALPLLLWAMVRMRPRFSWLVVIFCTLALLGRGSNEYLLELPPFLLGMVMAFSLKHIERVKELLRPRTIRNRAIEFAIVGACVSGLTADWWVTNSPNSALLICAGACLAVFAALVVGWLQRPLESRPLQWTGKRSYSLYLVHEPIVVALAFAAGGNPVVAVFVPVALLASLLAAAGFFGAVERPSHGFARRVGASCYRLSRGGRRGLATRTPVQARTDTG